MNKVLLVESWTQLLFLKKQYNSEIHLFDLVQRDIKKLTYPRGVTIVGNEYEQFIWT